MAPVWRLLLQTDLVVRADKLMSAQAVADLGKHLLLMRYIVSSITWSVMLALA